MASTLSPERFLSADGRVPRPGAVETSGNQNVSIAGEFCPSWGAMKFIVPLATIRKDECFMRWKIPFDQTFQEGQIPPLNKKSAVSFVCSSTWSSCWIAAQRGLLFWMIRGWWVTPIELLPECLCWACQGHQQLVCREGSESTVNLMGAFQGAET